MSDNTTWQAVLDYFPIIKWITGGVAVVIATLFGFIVNRYNKRIEMLEMTVAQLSRDSILAVTRPQMDELKADIDKKFNSMETKLMDHNESVNAKLDRIVWHLINDRN